MDLSEDNDFLIWNNIPISEKDDKQNSIASSSKSTSGKENDSDNNTKSGSSSKLLVIISYYLNFIDCSLSSPIYRTSRDLVTTYIKKPS
jgi:hypothetical protein